MESRGVGALAGIKQCMTSTLISIFGGAGNLMKSAQTNDRDWADR